MISKTVLPWLTLAALVGLCLGVMVPAASAATSISACPFTITVAGNYEVTKNLTATASDCIKVHTSNVAIDMKGHTITGDGTHDGITDNGIFVQEVAIAHGKIKNFETGIDFSGFFVCCESSDLITLEKIDASDNKEEGIEIEGCCNNITDVRANGNGAHGILVDDCCSVYNKIQANDNAGSDGLVAFGCCNTVNQVTADRNKDDGIDMRDCCTGISNSQANDNKANGLFVTSSDNSLANIRANGNTFAGTDLTGSDNHATNVTANNNGADGMEFGSSEEDVADSTANNNGDIGIDLANGDFNTATDVTANHNKTGVALEVECNAVNVRAHGNSVKDLSEIGGLCTNLLNNVGTGP